MPEFIALFSLHHTRLGRFWLLLQVILLLLAAQQFKCIWQDLCQPFSPSKTDLLPDRLAFASSPSEQQLAHYHQLRTLPSVIKHPDKRMILQSNG
jgi:hypothetical protein